MSNFLNWPLYHTNDAPVVTLADASGNARVLTGAISCYAEMKSANGTQGYQRIAGSAAITNAVTGQVTVTWGIADVATLGQFFFRIVVNYGSLLKPYEANLIITP